MGLARQAGHQPALPDRRSKPFVLLSLYCGVMGMIKFHISLMPCGAIYTVSVNLP
jgi:hypothetical protein